MNSIQAKHVRWARQHDWYINTYINMGFPVVVVQDYEDNDSSKPIELQFVDIDELQAWAGY